MIPGIVYRLPEGGLIVQEPRGIDLETSGFRVSSLSHLNTSGQGLPVMVNE